MALLLTLEVMDAGHKAVFPPGLFKSSWKMTLLHIGVIFAASSRSHTECTPSFGQRILTIISTDHRFLSSMHTCNWPLKGFSEQHSPRYCKFSTHKSCITHPHCKPQICSHDSLTLCFVFTKSLLTLGSNTEKDKSSFLVEFPEYL